MRRWEAREAGIAALRLVEAARPEPGPGEALIRVHAVSLNFRDGAILEGAMGAAGAWADAHVPRSDMAGEVAAVGAGVTRFETGDRVITSDTAHWIDGPAPERGTNAVPILGRLAEYVVVPVEQLVRAPHTLDAAAASTLPVAGLTAWFALIELARLRAGQIVVVQGTGGVALFAVQFAAAHGARIVVVSSSDDKLARTAALGASMGINRNTQPDWHLPVLEMTGGVGADHVLEMAGGDISRSLDAIAINGRISIVGLLGDTELRAPILSILYKRAQLIGIGVGHRRAQEDMVRAVDELGLKPVIDATYAFEDAPHAFEHLKRGPFGKVVVRVAPAKASYDAELDPSSLISTPYGRTS